MDGLYAEDHATRAVAVKTLTAIALRAVPSPVDFYRVRSGLWPRDLVHVDPVVTAAIAEAAAAVAALAASGVALELVPRSDARARMFAAAAAELGAASGHLALAHRHEHGLGVAQSCVVAFGHLLVWLPRTTHAAAAATQVLRACQHA
jgi:TPR repeat protein